MIAHLAGRLLEKHVQRLVVDVGGVGYEVIVPLSTYYGVGDPGAAIALRIHTHVREDALQLFGFATPLELSLFERLIAVNGIGPKVALSVLSGIEPPDLVRAIRQADLGRLTRIPGVGKKTAERLVIEMRDRVGDAPAANGNSDGSAAAASPVQEAITALVALGYKAAEAERAVGRLEQDDASTEDLIRQALRGMVRA